MTIESKEIIMHIRKGVMLSTRISYRSARAHPYISGLFFLLLILYRAFPSLFAFLISSSPVIVCTAILLGTLLSYGTPNIPEIEEEDEKTREISSLQMGSVVDDVVVKKDESFTVKTHLETDMVVNERAIGEAVGEASSSANNEIERDVPFSKMHGEGNLENYTDLTTSLLHQEDKKEMQSEMEVMEERVVDYGFVEKREFSIENLAEPALVLDADVHSVAVNDQNELEGLTIHIAKPASDGLFDSSLGSPWQPVNTYDASSDSDYDSDGAESSSPDASMADIIPMLDELHPLLDSEHPQPSLRYTDNSDSASSASSQDHESDDGIAEDGVENKEDADKESQEKDVANEVAVPWTADDEKNVMDLGYSEIERNRRLENLIAKRRLRKLQRFETEKNLIDLDSYYPSSIPSISAPRRNPFDLDYDFDESLNLPPIPGSAPSVLQPRQNPFDLPYGQVGEVSTLSREYPSHHDFVSSSQREFLTRRNDSSTTGPSFSGDSDQEKKGLNMKPYLFVETTDSEETGFSAFERQFAGQEDHKEELIGPEIHQESIMLSPINDDVEHVEQDRQSFEAADSIDNKHELSGMDVDIDRGAIGFNTSTEIKEIHQAVNTFGVTEEEIGEVEDNLPVSDTMNLEAIEERNEASNSSSLEANEKISGVHIHDEFVQSDRFDGAETADPVYDSSPSTIGKTLSNISAPDEALIYDENFISNSLPSDVQEDFSEVASPPRPFEASLSLEDRDLGVVRSEGEGLASGVGDVLVDSSDLSVVDEDESRLREITKINEPDSLLVGISENSGDVVHSLATEMPESAGAGHIMHSSSLSSVDSESSEDHSIDVDKSSQSEANDMINEPPPVDESVILLSPKAHVSESQVSSLDLPSIPEENIEDFILEEEHRNVMHPPASSCLAASQVVEESNVCMFDTEQEPSISQKPPEEIGNDDLAVGLVPETKNGDASGGSPTIPTHDGGFPGSDVPEQMENMEFSTLLEMKSEHEMGFDNELIDSQSKIKDEILTKQEEVFLKSLKDSDKESDDEVHPEVSGIEDIDESLLSELDVVGDFRVERELKSDQEGSNLELWQFDSIVEGSSTEMPDISNKLQDSSVSLMKDADTELGVNSEAKFSSSDMMNPVMDQPRSVKSEVGSSLLPSGEDPEMTVYNSKLHVLEACSFAELNSVFRQHHEEAVPPSDSTIESSIASKTEEETRELGISQEPTGTDTVLLVLQAKSVEDISSALKQLSEGLCEPSISEVETSEVLPKSTHLDPEEINSDLHVVEAKSLEDINLALKQLSEVTTESLTEQMKREEVLTEADASKGNHEQEVDVQPSESAASEVHLEPEHLEVQSAEEIKMDSGEEVSRSKASTSRKIRKKKSDKSGSGSSSTSSSSSSDSE